MEIEEDPWKLMQAGGGSFMVAQSLFLSLFLDQALSELSSMQVKNEKLDTFLFPMLNKVCFTEPTTFTLKAKVIASFESNKAAISCSLKGILCDHDWSCETINRIFWFSTDP